MSVKRKKIGLFLFLSFLCMFQIKAQGVSMSPTRLFLTGEAGETVTATVVLNNNSQEEYVFNINLKDWHRNLSGEKIYFEPNTRTHSNANWVSTEESIVTLPPQSTIELTLKMEIPEDVSPSEVTNSMLFFTQIGKAEDAARMQNGIGVITLFEFGLHIYYTPLSNKKKSLDIQSIEHPEPSRLVVGIENDGNVVNDAKVDLELTEVNTGEDVEIKGIPISMLPGAYQEVKFNLPAELSGEYLAVVIIRMAGTNDLRVGEKKLHFK